MPRKKILLLSAYDASSHRYWHHQLASQFPQYHWQILTLQDRHFSWRMGGNALNFQAIYDHELKQQYDLLIATSMTDLATLRGLYPNLATIPNILYFHENQFAYPVNHQQKGLLEIQMRSLYAAIAADKLTFNSHFNFQSFMDGVSALVSKMPDGIPNGITESLSSKSSIIPVPINDDCEPATAQSKNGIKVVWNHRWEHDKGPEALLELLKLCNSLKTPVSFYILGQKFRNIPTAMQQLIANHSSQCKHIGFIDSRTKYIKVLQNTDVVLSTALHDFQGIAMMEAVSCGCTPIAPARLVYPELYPKQNLYPSNPEEPKQEAQSILHLLLNPNSLQDIDMTFQWQHLKSRYQKWLNQF